MNLKKILLKIFSANFLQTIVSIVVGFIVPAILSFDGYANLKTYTLYMSYIGIFHLGFADGIYLKYGGKSDLEINYSILKGEHLFLIFFQIVVTLVFIVFSFIFDNEVLFLVSLSILPANLVNFHKQFCQAVGKFDTYSRILNIYSYFYIIINIILVFVLKISTYEFYCLTSFICNLLVIIFAEANFIKLTKNYKIFINKEILVNIKTGFFLMLGNLIAIFLYAIDKWFVKIFFDNVAFSYYSFAVSMFNIIVVFLNSICATFYNVFAKGKSESYIISVKQKILVLGSYCSAFFFIISFFINLFLKKYISSLSIIACTFATFPYLFVIKAIFINLYKSTKQEKLYSKKVIIMLFVSIIFNIIAILINKNVICISLATLLAFIVWYLFSLREFKYLNSFKDIIFLIITTIVFLISSHIGNIYIGFFIYFIIITVESKILYKLDLLKILRK